MTAENGSEVIAKIPCPDVVPSRSSTASEAALLNYVRSKASVPVPKVLSWSSESSNGVRSEYIVMKKADGIQLVDVWGDMDQIQRFQLIKDLARLETELASLKFAACGSLYFCDSPDAKRQIIPINKRYGIGPVYNASWFPHCGNEAHAGPWTNLSELGIGLANRGLAHIQDSPLTPRGPHFGTRADHIRLLHSAKKVIAKFAHFPPLHRFSRPILWHGDLHLGNIFVAREDPTTIVRIIDWQFISIMPAFMQSQWPTFLRPPENYTFGLVKPDLPPNFETMDDDEKAFAESERDQALLAKCYEVVLAKRCPEAYAAWTKVDSPIRDLFSLVDRTCKDGVVPLRDALIRISEVWDQMGFEGPCPYQPTDDDLARHTLELARYKDWHTLKGYTQELLRTDDDGWVNPQLDFHKVRARHDELFQLYMERETEVISEEEGKSLWFYIDRP
ncbi:serine/threonine protein kinase [Aspergillus carlsbadensis]|nr:serine/threonine protein kinase [Aspergillus carlsbadensis]